MDFIATTRGMGRQTRDREARVVLREQKYFGSSRISLSMFFVIFFTILTVETLSAGDWKTVRDENGIRVDTRQVSGYEFHAFRGTTMVEASMDQLVAFLEDIPNMARWFYLVSEARVLERHAPNRSRIYVVQKAPFVKDRDIVAELVIRQMPDRTVLLDMTQDNGFFPESDQYIRVPKFQARYTLTPGPDGIELVFEALSDPGGSIPAWLANGLIVDIPFRSLSKLRRTNFDAYSGKNTFDLNR